MQKTKALFVLAGYFAPSAGRLSQITQDLDRRFGGGVFKFIGLEYPRRREDLPFYVKKVGDEMIDQIFGPGAATIFCRDDGSPCSAGSKGREGIHIARSRCAARGSQVACLRMRPQNIVVVCNEKVRGELFDMLGRAVLMISHEAETAIAADLATTIESRIQELQTAWNELNNLGSEREVAYLPFRNFQEIGKHGIAAAIQANPQTARAILSTWRKTLYDPDFFNLSKKRRGGYRLAGDVYFQRDRLHTNTAHIGSDSRKHAFHLLNAYYLYGISVDPNFQFDVMSRDGGPLKTEFSDVISGRISDRRATHVDITPCDRLL